MRFVAIFAAMAVLLPVAANAEKFNLDCKASKVELTGTDTWGENLYSKEREDAWLSEATEIALDLSAKTHCVAKYCTEETYGAPEPIAKIDGKIITLSIRPVKVYESNDYNEIASEFVIDLKKMVLIDHYKYYQENSDKILGNQKITYSCKKKPYKLYGKE